MPEGNNEHSRKLLENIKVLFMFYNNAERRKVAGKNHATWKIIEHTSRRGILWVSFFIILLYMVDIGS